MKHTEIIFALLGQSFTYDPPEGQPSGTPTVQVFASSNDDDGGATETAAGACTVDSVSTTLSVAASRGEQTLTVASGTGITRLRRYLLAAANGEREWIDVATISGTTVGLRRPLSNSYAVTTSTLKGCRISAAVDATWVNTKSKLTDVLTENWRTDEETEESAPGAPGYRLRWAYTVDSVATIGVSYADLVRYGTKNLVLPTQVDDKYAGWIDRLPTDHQRDQGARIIDEAVDAVRLDALGDAQVLRRIRDQQVMHGLIVDKANVLALEAQLVAGANVTAISAMLVTARDIYQQRYNQLIREPKIAIDQVGGGAGGEAKRLPVWRR